LIRPVNWALDHFFRGFNWLFERTTQVYGKTVGWCLRLSVIVLVVYAGLIGLTGFEFSRVPSGFVPIQDKGYLVTNIQLPDSASLERTVEATEKVEKIALETPGVAHRIHLDNAGAALMPACVLDAMTGYLRREAEIGGYEAAAEASLTTRSMDARTIPMTCAAPQGAPVAARLLPLRLACHH
jgi:multidrug efflux pump subunit AcrB